MQQQDKTNARFRALLEREGKRVTRARLFVLAVLEGAKRPIGVEEIRQRLRGQNFDQATVYRTLSCFLRAGLVRRIDLQRGHALYELADLGEHHHVVCVQCESVADVRNCCAKGMDTIALKESGFAAVKEHSLEFFGVCRRCARNRN